MEAQEEDGRVTVKLHIENYSCFVQSDKSPCQPIFQQLHCIGYSNVQTFGNSPTCFGLFSGHSQGSMQQKKQQWLITSYVCNINLLDRND